MEGYPSMEGGQYTHDGYGGGSFGAQGEGQNAAPFEGLGVEENQLLWSVLSSTPVSEQYNLAYPQSAPPNAAMWDVHPNFQQHMGSFSGYGGQGVPSHMQAAMQAPRQQPMMHHSMSSQVHQSVSSSQAHMSGQVGASQFGVQQGHNPFSLRNDSPIPVSVKHEGVVPLFTPNTAPYAAPGGANVNQNYAQSHMASHGAPPATQRTFRIDISILNNVLSKSIVKRSRKGGSGPQRAHFPL